MVKWFILKSKSKNCYMDENIILHLMKDSSCGAVCGNLTLKEVSNFKVFNMELESGVVT